jgi:glycosyltransferase involved in cell wall biosynthesis
MRIVFVISQLLMGGAETQLISISRELALRGHAIAIYTLNRNNPRADELINSDVSLIEDQKRMKLDFSVVLRLRNYINEFNADLVHGFLFDGNVYARLSGIGLKIPVISSERNDNYSLNIFQQIAYKCTNHFSKAVIANSYSGANFAKNMFKLNDMHVHVVWNGVDLVRLEERIKSSSEINMQKLVGGKYKVACLVGAIKPQKDYLLALKVAELLTNNYPDWRVIFVGDALSTTGEYKQCVLTLFNELKLKDKAFFLGMRKDVICLMSKSQVVFSTSIHEGFPNVVLEAMATGVPVVSTEYSDIRKILPLRWQVVNTRDPQILVDSIIQANLENEKIVSLQKEWVKNNSTIQQAATNLEKIYAVYIK